MTEKAKTYHGFDLEKRTLLFCKDVLFLCQMLPKNVVNTNLVSQLVRSSGSIGANYREANDPLGKKDFVMRLKIARKEAKETEFWLELLEAANPPKKQEIRTLSQECIELKKILSAIISKVGSRERV